MNLSKNLIRKILLLSVLPLALAACQSEEQISYAKNVKPILDKYCMECHLTGGEGQQVSGFDMSTYDNLMKGTHGGSMIISGDSEGSNMLVLMAGRADPSLKMPHGKMTSVAGKELETIKLWIDHGAKDN